MLVNHLSSLGQWQIVEYPHSLKGVKQIYKTIDADKRAWLLLSLLAES